MFTNTRPGNSSVGTGIYVYVCMCIYIYTHIYIDINVNGYIARHVPMPCLCVLAAPCRAPRMRCCETSCGYHSLRTRRTVAAIYAEIFFTSDWIV